MRRTVRRCCHWSQARAALGRRGALLGATAAWMAVVRAAAWTSRLDTPATRRRSCDLYAELYSASVTVMVTGAVVVLTPWLALTVSV